MSNFDLIIGLHSICAALKNPSRQVIRLLLTEDGKEELRKRFDLRKVDFELVSTHKLQEEAKKLFQNKGLEYQRVPSGALLCAESLPEYEVRELYDLAKKGNLKILCLDQITDVHNGAAILRTASFYGIDVVILPGKKSFGTTPTYFRIASGAHEYLKLVMVGNLSKTLTKLKELNTHVIGLSEHAEESLDLGAIPSNKNLALVLGKEETGISNAVMRVLDEKLSIQSQGSIKSLNVSVAAAISMEKCFGI
ncbi:MAG: hypothetical protein CME67_04265 [Halobacteriovoraceae bacterium]|nr:hypothetical protein [Peredibacter sp.]MBJ00423.1 hypothetical protein [Halobacteriovoraceae bacterium]|tara:strand:- start:155 stop:907 length:753 start_codon:yes stop_codon:yes gene_type:complete